MDLISRLLDVNESIRLGSGAGGGDAVKAHAFFRGLDWDKLEHKQVEPPVVPTIADLPSTDCPFPDMQAMLNFYEREHWIHDVPSADCQALFNSWYVDSLHY